MTMRIYMLENRKGSQDGYTVEQFTAGFEYEVKDFLGAHFISKGWAKEVNPRDPKKPRVRRRRSSAVVAALLLAGLAFAGPAHGLELEDIERQWERVKPTISDAPEREMDDRELWRLSRRINQQVNSGITYKAEPKGAEYWQTPQETLGRKKGDCEDIAILKMHLLRKAGVPADRLRIVYMRTVGEVPDLGGAKGHAALAVERDEDTLYLDNRYPEPKAALFGLEVVKNFD